MHTIRGISRPLAQLEVLALARNQKTPNVHRRSLAQVVPMETMFLICYGLGDTSLLIRVPTDTCHPF